MTELIRHATLCFLSFNRPDVLKTAIEMAVKHAGRPIQVIIHDDGSDLGVQHELLDFVYHSGLVSRLICGPTGECAGIGLAMNRAIALATGDPIVRIDQNVIFEEGWLDALCSILECDPNVGLVGAFKHNVAPADWRENQLEWTPEMSCPAPPGLCVPYHYVSNFVGSVTAIRRAALEAVGSFPERPELRAANMEFKSAVLDAGYCLALPDEDVAHCISFSERAPANEGGYSLGAPHEHGLVVG